MKLLIMCSYLLKHRFLLLVDIAILLLILFNWNLTINSVCTKIQDTNGDKMKNTPATNVHARADYRSKQIVPTSQPPTTEQLTTTLNPICPKIIPETVYGYNYKLLIEHTDKCANSETVNIIYLIKSAPKNIDRRHGIRYTWGNDTVLEKYNIKKLFVMGIDENNTTVEAAIMNENNMHNDILLANYHDVYFNLSIKVMIGLNWARKYCSHAKYFIVTDDNTYVSNKNLLKYLLNETNINIGLLNYRIQFTHDALEYEGAYRLYGGSPYFGTPPVRGAGSVWTMTEEEYPYPMYPNYISGVFSCMNRPAVEDFYKASLVTKNFKFDDTYLGFLSAWAGIDPRGMPNCLAGILNISLDSDIREIMFSHGYTPEEMIRIREREKVLNRYYFDS